jgi:hypothetical protein
MCCEFILKYFRDYEEIEDLYEEENSFEKALNILIKNEPGLIFHYSHNGNVTFSDKFPRWYRSLPDPFFTFISNFEIVQATCDIKQLFYMGKLHREQHHLFFILVRDYYKI